MIVLYYTVKILSWAGLLFCLLAVVKPEVMARCIIKAATWKLSWFGLSANIQQTAQTSARMRALSVLLAVVFTGLIYVLTEIVTVAHVIK